MPHYVALLSSVAFSPVHVACFQWSVAHFPVVVCGIIGGTLSVGSCLRALSLLHVPLGLLPAAPAPSVPCRMVCAACCLSHVASRHGARAALRVVCRMLHDARPLLMLSLGRWLSQLARCVSHAVCCNVAERHSAVTHAAHRGGASQLSASVAGKTRCRPRCAWVRACVRACG